MKEGKKDRTREKILHSALLATSKAGLESITIGELASEVGLSKSGLFAHFGSRERLQAEVLERIEEEFRREVVKPLSSMDPGPEKVRRALELWMDWATSPDRPGGCPVASAMFEYDAIDSPLRQIVKDQMERWLQFLATASGGERGSDVAQTVLSLYLGFHVQVHLLGRSTPEARENAVRQLREVTKVGEAYPDL